MNKKKSHHWVTCRTDWMANLCMNYILFPKCMKLFTTELMIYFIVINKYNGFNFEKLTYYILLHILIYVMKTESAYGKVIRLDGNSRIVAHVWINLGYLIRLRLCLDLQQSQISDLFLSEFFFIFNSAQRHLSYQLI